MKYFNNLLKLRKTLGKSMGEMGQILDIPPMMLSVPAVLSRHGPALDDLLPQDLARSLWGPADIARGTAAVH